MIIENRLMIYKLDLPNNIPEGEILKSRFFVNLNNDDDSERGNEK
jgi:hypothetical protein